MTEERPCQDSDIRAGNNFLWMRGLEIALKANALTKDVLRQINENDQRISKLLGNCE